MKLKKLLGYFIRCFTKPATTDNKGSIIRSILLKPILFDLVSFIIQVKDLKKIINLETPEKRNLPKDIAHRHNLKEIQEKLITTTRRVEPAYQIANMPIRNVSKEKILIIGCRNVVELYQAYLYGYSWKNIFGFDLYSTNRKIKVGNMEDLKDIENESFDVVTLVNTLSYSRRPDKVFKQISRVLRVDGKFVFNHAYSDSGEKIFSQYSGDEMVNLNDFKKDKIEKLLEENSLKIYFEHQYVKKKRDDYEIYPTWYGTRKWNYQVN